tara:strand:+ start:32031 stop:32459 length:429 start_codon:yes stop_codon:yes gene_type:complete
MALVAGGVHGNAALVLYMGRPMPVKGPLHLVHVQFPRQLAADLADHLKILQPVRAKIDITEKLPVQVPVQLFHKFAVRESGIVLQEHQAQFALGREDGPGALFGLLQFEGRYQFAPRDGDIDLAQVALDKSGEKDIELLCLG